MTTSIKIDFLKVNDFYSLKHTTPVLLLSEEDVQKSSFKPVKIAQEKFKFTGAANQVHSIPLNEKDVVILVGIGSQKKIDDLQLQKIGSRLCALLNGSKTEAATIFFDSKTSASKIEYPSQNPTQICEIAFGAYLQSYRFNKYFNSKKKDKELKVKSITFAVSDVAKTKKEFEKFELLARNVFFVRDLVSEPSNNLNPESYAKICKSLAKKGLQVEVLGEKEMQKLGMNSLLGVGQGSEKKSQLVILKYNGAKNKKEKPIAFVGKGVTFDTGGISIKPSANMEDMKTDMAGSAVVVGLLKHLSERKAKVNAIGVVGLVENMPSGTAQRPGDVVTSMSGQTIEVINTDAEGRLVLADALHYTNTKFKPKFIVDLATLTGAIIVSLADVYSGLFSNDDKLSEQLIKSGKKVGEPTWRLPLGEEYDDMINSDIADMKNVGSGRGAGSITAAQFLKRFIGETPWVHLDIAGVAWKGKGDAMAVKGATGYGLRLLNQLVEDNYEQN